MGKAELQLNLGFSWLLSPKPLTDYVVQGPRVSLTRRWKLAAKTQRPKEKEVLWVAGFMGFRD